MKLSIRNKLLMSFAASIIVPVVLICILLGYRILQNARERFIVSTRNELRQVDGAIQIFFQEAGFNVIRLAEHDVMQEMTPFPITQPPPRKEKTTIWPSEG